MSSIDLLPSLIHLSFQCIDACHKNEMEANGISQPSKPSKADPIPKPPRKSKLPEPVTRMASAGSLAAGSAAAVPDAASRLRFKKNEEAATPVYQSSHIPRFQQPSDPNQANTLSSKRFKMLRLKKDAGTNSELGIVISKKRNPQKGTSGYIIAHIEPGGLVERY